MSKKFAFSRNPVRYVAYGLGFAYMIHQVLVEGQAPDAVAAENFVNGVLAVMGTEFMRSQVTAPATLKDQEEADLAMFDFHADDHGTDPED